ncbi:MAG: integrase [Gammaproteobacteria bacterium]|nr:MAG: integrase [Gammaproteobacteria bacterium]
MKDLHPIALFRLSVLGPLISRSRLERGELKPLIQELASRDYDIPGTDRCRIGEKTIEAWYYRWRREGIEALTPQLRLDRGQSKLSTSIQEAITTAKRDNPRRSIDLIISLLEQTGTVARGELSRSSVHRLLQRQGLSRLTGSASLPEEHRAYVAEYAGDIWYGDVMHGPRVPVKGRLRKVYLVSLMDDASRLLTHSAFCTGEKALDIEGVLKQAVLRRGLPAKLVVDNGSAYRAGTLQGICARLGIHLVYCRPYAPEGKGKLERWHRTFRDQFLSELDPSRLQDLGDLNARLWAWLESVYHCRSHRALDGQTPLQRYQQDLPRIRTLGPRAARLDELFYHRIARKVRKDGTVSYQGERFEVPYELSGQSVQLVVDPHAEQVIGVEDAAGKSLGAATPLDAVANNHRTRRKPRPVTEESVPGPAGSNLVEMAYQHYHGAADPMQPDTETKES